MIELDIAVYDMFDLPPLSEYEVYVKKFGTGNTRQVSKTLSVALEMLLFATNY